MPQTHHPKPSPEGSQHLQMQGELPNAFFPVPDEWLQQVFSTPNAVLLESGIAVDGHPRSYLFTHPEATLELRRNDDVNAFFQQLSRWQQQGYYLAGFLTYEAGYLLESTLPDPPDGLLAWFGVYARPQIWDHHQPVPAPRPTPLQSLVSRLHFTLQPEEYKQTIQAIQQFIRDGDIYQLNFTAPFHFTLTVPPLKLYRTLRTQQPTPYQAVIHLPDRLILSFSPELFFAVQGKHISAQPMKGTHPRGRFLEEDEQFAQFLQQDRKNQAENLMIADLIRNDLNRVCVPGSVKVTRPLIVERYPTVLQMTTRIEGKLSPTASWEAIFRALFPCGSITGAPKIRAMQIIHQLEKYPRGVYTGAIGYLSPEGEAQFSVAIRTLEFEGNRGKMGSGSGIVWDSRAESEYAECQLKARFLHQQRPEFQLLETMRWEAGTIPLLPLHLNRLKASAHYFQYPFHAEALTVALHALGEQLNPENIYRIRLLLNRYGQWTLQAQVMNPLTFPGTHIARAAHPVNSKDVFLYHKTTYRPLFDAYFRAAQAAGLADVIFLNERKEVTQGCISNIFMVKDGQWFTPPLESGLLNGVLRQHLMTTQTIIEQPLQWDDLLQADAVYIGNALRGLQQVTLKPDELRIPI